MIKPVGKSNRRGSAVAWGGGAVVVVGLLQFLKAELAAFNLDTWPLFVISGAIFVAGLAIGQIDVARGRRQADQELEQELDDALACWPPRFAASLTPHDVGVRPALRAEPVVAPYLERDVDVDGKQLPEAMRSSPAVVVFGPPRAGKSRTAFAAVPGEAIMLIPEHAEGLAALLRRWDALRTDDDAVLWLDGLERYAEGVDVDPILAFLTPRPKPGRLRRLLPGGRRPSPTRRLVATIREDRLEALLDGDDPGTYPVRRLMTLASGVRLSDELSDRERKRFEQKFGAPPPSSDVAEAFHSAWRAGWRAERTPAPDSTAVWHARRVAVWPIALGLVFLGASGWIYAKHDELTVPLPIEEQVASLVDAAVEVFPPKGEGIGDDSDANADVLVAVEHGGGCGVSDQVRFYRVRNRRLREIAALTPEPSMSRHTFECLGRARKAASTCHVTIEDADDLQHVIVGAFEDAQTHQQLPVAISLQGQELQVWALGLPRAKLDALPPSVRRRVRRPMEVRLRVGDTEVDAACKENPYCSRGRPAQETAIIPSRAGRPALLLAAYTAKGTTDAPQELLVRMWKLELDDGRPAPGRSCVILRDGRIRRVVLDAETPLLEGWRPEGTEFMC